MCSPRSAKEAIVKSSRPLLLDDVYVKAASGIVAHKDDYFIVQDSSRFLARVRNDTIIDFFPLAPQQLIELLEDLSQPYIPFRKERKADFETITTLPDGRFLILGSGYDAHKIESGESQHYKNQGAIFDPVTSSYQAIDLAPLYSQLIKDVRVVGGVEDGIAPRLNVEGLAILDRSTVALFHRANYNKNFHDSMIVYDLDAWLLEIGKETWKLEPKSITKLDFGFVVHEGKKFPVTLNDAMFFEGYLYIPVSVETDMIVDGEDVDGEVVWKGLAKLTVESPQKCEMFNFSDPNLPKIEGIAPHPKNYNEFVVVHDVDSEEAPSLMSAISLPK